MDPFKALKPGAAATATGLLNGEDHGMINAVATSKPTTSQPGWRDRLPVHPAAELLPLMSKDELRELADDIKRNGLIEPVRAGFDPKTRTYSLLDGRNRLDALELLGRKIFSDPPPHQPDWTFSDDGMMICKSVNELEPVRYVISANVHRRHLTSEQKRELIAKLLKLYPEKSNRQLAAMTGRDDKTIASVRADLERTADIPQLKTTEGKDGKRRPTRRKKTKTDRVGTSVVSSAEVPATSVTPISEISRENSAEQPQQEDNTAFDHQSRHALAEFKYACKAYLPKMNAAHRQEAVDHVASIVAKIDKAAP